MAVEPLLSVENLVTTFKTERGKICPVDKVNFSVAPGKTLAIVGESGSGKSVTALSIMQLLPKGNGAIEGGRVMFEGEDQRRSLHGRDDVCHRESLAGAGNAEQRLSRQAAVETVDERLYGLGLVPGRGI